MGKLAMKSICNVVLQRVQYSSYFLKMISKTVKSREKKFLKVLKLISKATTVNFLVKCAEGQVQ